ncbi:hypothetical protein, partial [Leyella stercorea]|uniref:hypothetical protein n=1 Tax=Leyella stercorea TaxID=363265 RepID=UPI001F27B99D
AKVLEVCKKAIPLHPLSRSNDISSKCERGEAKQEANKESLCKSSAMKLASIAEAPPNLWKEFFEKIYIRQK